VARQLVQTYHIVADGGRPRNVPVGRVQAVRRGGGGLARVWSAGERGRGASGGAASRTNLRQMAEQNRRNMFR